MAGSIATIEDNNNGLLTITTRPCVVCAKASTVVVAKQAYEDWQRGQHIQHAFPDMTADEREVLISGTHASCWDILYGEDDEDA